MIAGILLFFALVFALIETARAKSLGWLAVAFIAAALLVPHLGGFH